MNKNKLGTLIFEATFEAWVLVEIVFSVLIQVLLL